MEIKENINNILTFQHAIMEKRFGRKPVIICLALRTVYLLFIYLQNIGIQTDRI